MKNANTTALLAAFAQRIADLRLEEIITNPVALIVSLFLSHPRELHRIAREHSEDCPVREQAAAAFRLHDDEEHFDFAASELGLFSTGIDELLDLADSDRIIATRIMPILRTALDLADDLYLEDEQVERLAELIEQRVEADGFELVENDEGELEIELAI